MSQLVSLTRTTATGVTSFEAEDGKAYFVNKVGASYFVTSGRKIVAEAGTYKAAREAITALVGAPVEPEVDTAAVRAYAVRKGLARPGRGRLPRAAFEAYANRPRRDGNGRFVKAA